MTELLLCYKLLGFKSDGQELRVRDLMVADEVSIVNDLLGINACNLIGN